MRSMAQAMKRSSRSMRCIRGMYRRPHHRALARAPGHDTARRAAARVRARLGPRRATGRAVLGVAGEVRARAGRLR